MIIKSLQLRIDMLISNPDCDTSADDYESITWRDSRSLPAAADLLAISDAEIEHVIARRAMICSRWQFRKALNQLGLRAAVDAVIANPATPLDIRDGFESAERIERLHPDVIAIGSMLNQSDANMDNLFVLAMTL